MKKSVSFIITALSSFLIQAQDSRIQSIDSLVKTFGKHEIILLFSESKDTIDNFTGKKYIQKNSYYFDWVNKELRFIDVYYFDGQKKHYRRSIFGKKGKTFLSRLESSIHFLRTNRYMLSSLLLKTNAFFVLVSISFLMMS